MATNFPGSLDAFTNPSSSDTLDNPPHDQQHADANDAIEAIETALLDGAPLHIDDANERVGIGTTSPTASLTVTSATDDAKVKIDSNGSSVGIIDATANTNDATGRWLSINPSGGYVGINDNSPSYQLDVNGDINTTGYLRRNGNANFGGALYCYTAGWTSTWGSTWYSRDWTITAPAGTTFTNVVITPDPKFAFRHSIATIKSLSSSSCTFALSSYGGATDGYIRYVNMTG